MTIRLTSKTVVSLSLAFALLASYYWYWGRSETMHAMPPFCFETAALPKPNRATHMVVSGMAPAPSTQPAYLEIAILDGPFAGVGTGRVYGRYRLSLADRLITPETRSSINYEN